MSDDPAQQILEAEWRVAGGRLARPLRHSTRSAPQPRGRGAARAGSRGRGVRPRTTCQTDSLRGAYDAFISHNHADKDWARHLAERVAGVDYEGRQLRPWLDEQFLDPGELGREAELTSALDRSRTLLLVLSPASVASRWVNFELDYFLRAGRSRTSSRS